MTSKSGSTAVYKYGIGRFLPTGQLMPWIEFEGDEEETLASAEKWLSEWRAGGGRTGAFGITKQRVGTWTPET